MLQEEGVLKTNYQHFSIYDIMLSINDWGSLAFAF